MRVNVQPASLPAGTVTLRTWAVAGPKVLLNVDVPEQLESVMVCTWLAWVAHGAEACSTMVKAVAVPVAVALRLPSPLRAGGVIGMVIVPSLVRPTMVLPGLLPA